MSTGLLLFVSVDSREGAPAAVEADPDWTVGQLKQSALAAVGFDAESTVARLVFAGEELQDRQLLADSGVSSEATLELRTLREWSLGWSGPPERVVCGGEEPATVIPNIHASGLVAHATIFASSDGTDGIDLWVDVLPEVHLPCSVRLSLWVSLSDWSHYAGVRLSGTQDTREFELPNEDDHAGRAEEVRFDLRGYNLTIADSESSKEFDLSDWGSEKITFGAYVYSERARVSLEAWEGPRGPLPLGSDE
eukprot:TRINITY_DN3399_c1_g4_i1.p1 TRINITY_DN3399_c1_g4~~TRINITY_DN3399_c1_g4_i1.p1  ORF type:complete len:250 (+),score=26.27 TRINITY_DN3399_c1_g4_i1:50-799(+)